MPDPVSRRELIRRLRALGFDGPFPGSKHSIMIKGRRKLRIPNPHGDDIGAGLLMRILREAGITTSEWNDA